jgi:hypothetical protein
VAFNPPRGAADPRVDLIAFSESGKDYFLRPIEQDLMANLLRPEPPKPPVRPLGGEALIDHRKKLIQGLLAFRNLAGIDFHVRAVNLVIPLWHR